MPPIPPGEIRLDPYTESDLAEIAKSLGVNAFTDEQVRQLQRAGNIYRLVDGGDFQTKADNDPTAIRPGRAAQRKALKNVAQIARQLAGLPQEQRKIQGWKQDAALTDRGLWLTGLSSLRQSLDLCSPTDLDQLAEIAQDLAEHIPPTGHEPKQATLVFIDCLIPLYESITGKKAGRRVRWETFKEYGPFKQFVCAALEPLNSTALKGVDKTRVIVTKAVENVQNHRNSRARPAPQGYRGGASPGTESEHLATLALVG